MRYIAYLIAYGPAAVIITLSVPMILGKVPPNPTYGFRTRKTLSSPDIWYPANRMSGWFLTIACVIAILLNSAVLFGGFESAQFAWFGMGLFIPLVVALFASLAYLKRL